MEAVTNINHNRPLQAPVTTPSPDSLPVSMAKVMSHIDDYLDLGRSPDLSLNGLSQEEKETYYKMIGKLGSLGIVGYNFYEVNGQVEKHFITNQIGDDRLKYAEKIELPQYTIDYYA